MNDTPRTSTIMEFDISGMTCTACSTRLEKVLNRKLDPHGGKARVNFATETLRVQWADNTAALPSALILESIAQAGFSGVLHLDDDPIPPLEKPIPPMNSWEYWQSPLSEKAQCVGSMIFFLPLMVPMFLMIGNGFNDSHDIHGIMLSAPWQAFLAGVVQFGFGAKFYRGGWSALRAGAANMDTLVAIGTSAAFAVSLVVWLWDLPPHELYFESSAGIISFVLLGKMLEARAKRNSHSAWQSLISLAPATAHLLTKNPQGLMQELEVPTRSLMAGDRVRVRAGESIPGDGVVVLGQAFIDESMLTGESQPKRVGMGDSVLGATINTDGLLEINIQSDPHHSLLSQIIAQMREAQSSKAEIQALADRFAALFVPMVMGLSLISFIGWFVYLDFFTEFTGSIIWTKALIHAATVLVIACPCAVGLATPTAIVVAMGLSAKYGILVRDMGCLETLARVQRVVFDKTGTLTQGKLTMNEGTFFSDVAPSTALSIAASLEQGSVHPIAHAVRAKAKQQALILPSVTSVDSLPGLGLCGKLHDSNDSYLLGSRALMTQFHLALPTELSPDSPHQIEDVSTDLWLARKSEDQTTLIARWTFSDTLRDNALHVIQTLIARGVNVSLLSGDRSVVVERLVHDWSLPPHQFMARGGMLPQEKMQAIRTWQSSGEKVVMVGDGINDAPALALADVGIAMGAGSETAIKTAGIALLGNDLQQILSAMDLARSALATIHRNLFFAFVFNVVCIPSAMLGGVGPLLAGMLMAMSSVSVVTSSLWLKRWKPQLS